MKRKFRVSVICVLCLIGILGARFTFVKINYPRILDEIESKRIDYLTSLQSAASKKDKEDVVDQARNYIHDIVPRSIFPSWYGTPWSFNGAAEYPLQGSIACGSFVESVLKNVGFDVDHRLSAQPAEYIIKSMCDDHDIARFSNVPIASFNDEVKNLGEGIYIVGLDSHVGFLYVLKGKYRFVHSHGYLCVVSEIPSLSPTLRRSKYRVVGKLSSNKMIKNWLYGKKVPLRYNYYKEHQVN